MFNVNHELYSQARGPLDDGQELQDEEANGDPDEEGANKIKKYGDKNTSNDVFNLCRSQVLNVSTETCFDLKDSQDALSESTCP